MTFLRCQCGAFCLLNLGYFPCRIWFFAYVLLYLFCLCENVLTVTKISYDIQIVLWLSTVVLKLFYLGCTVRFPQKMFRPNSMLRFLCLLGKVFRSTLYFFRSINENKQAFIRAWQIQTFESYDVSHTVCFDMIELCSRHMLDIAFFMYFSSCRSYF